MRVAVHRTPSWIVTFAATLGGFLAMSCQADAQDRVALLVSNSNYDEQTLPHVKDDLPTLAKALRDAGFEVTVKENVDKNLDLELEAFARACPDGGVSLFYFAGFGNRFQRKVTEKGTRPDGTEEKVESLVWDTGIQPIDEPARDFLRLSEIAEIFSRESTARLHVLLFDCAVGNEKTPAGERGLGRIAASQFPSALVCYAMPPEKVLESGSQSMLADSLARHVTEKGREIGEAMAEVREDVAQRTGGKQQVWYDFSLPIDATVALVPSTRRTIHTSKLPPENPQLGDEWINGLGMVFCWCPPGSFRMGVEDPQSHQAEDAPPVDVTISEGFWIGKYEMACGTFRRMGKGPKGTPIVEHSNIPLTNINGPGALDMGKMIVERSDEKKEGRIPEGWEYRLPTEAEWEYACRAGSSSLYSFGDSVDELCRYANYADRSLHEDDDTFWYSDVDNVDGVGLRPAALGSYLPNPWGIHDMHGNVTEYCGDRYSPVLPGGTDPKVRDNDGNQIVLRGGAWCSTPQYCLAGFRHKRKVSHNDRGAIHLGLRMVLARKNKDLEKKK